MSPLDNRCKRLFLLKVLFNTVNSGNYNKLPKEVKIKYSEHMNIYEAHKLSDQLGLALKDIRESNKISKRQIEREAAISKTSVLNIETGYRKPSLYILLMYADYLKISLSDLLMEIEIGENEHRKTFLETVKLLRNIDPKTLKTIQKKIKEILDLKP